MRIWGITTAICLLPLSTLWAFNAHQPFDISSDVLDYNDALQVMTAQGHAVVVQSSSTLSADYMRYERHPSHLVARGHVILHDKGSILLGETLDYDLDKEQGTMDEGKGIASAWKIQGGQWQKFQDYTVGRQTSFTTCDLIDPHYHIRSSRIHVVPDRHFWAWNNVAYADTVPVFYSPFIYKSLERKRLVIQFQPGHNDVNGNFVKTITTLRFTDQIYDKLLFDHYSISGNGIGNELNYSPTPDVKGSFFGYYINPHGNPELSGAPQQPQYNIRSYHWQRWGPLYTLQSSINLRKNVSFNNQYFPQDTAQGVTDITSSVALTRQSKRINQRVVLERLDAPDSSDSGPFAPTHMQSASFPRYEFSTFSIPLWSPAKSSGLSGSSTTISGVSTTTLAGLPRVIPRKGTIGPVQFSMGGFAQDGYQRIDDKLHPKAQSQISLSDSIQLPGRLSFTPSLTPVINWQDRFDMQAGASPGALVPILGSYQGFQGHMATSNVLRWAPSSSFTADQTHSFSERLVPNALQLDRGLPDGGTESNHLGWLLFVRPSRTFLVRSFSGYDLRRISDEDLDVYRQRKWDPWSNELTWNPGRNIDHFLRYQIGYYPIRTLQWEASTRYRGWYSTIIETGLLYTRGLPGLLTWNNRIGVFFSPSWRVDATVHSLVPAVGSATMPSSIIDSEIMVTRNLHCWEAQFIYRNRPPITREYSILFNLKFNTQPTQQIPNQELESQFYSWRASPYAH